VGGKPRSAARRCSGASAEHHKVPNGLDGRALRGEGAGFAVLCVRIAGTAGSDRSPKHICASSAPARGAARTSRLDRPSRLMHGGAGSLSGGAWEGALVGIAHGGRATSRIRSVEGDSAAPAAEAVVASSVGIATGDDSAKIVATEASGEPADDAASEKEGYSIQTNDNVKISWEKIIRWGRVERKKERDSDVLAKTKKVAVFGGGSFGTAMGCVLARNNPEMEVVLLMRNPGTVQSINDKHINDRYLPNHVLPDNVRATAEPGDAIAGAQYIVHAVPVQSSRGFLSGVKDLIPLDVPICCVSKGLEVGTGEMMSELIPSALERQQPLAVLSGPTFAIEMMDLQPTAITCASEDPHLALTVQRLFACEYLRVNTSNDVVGVEIAGALKNVLAIAAGIVEGLELGNNAMAALTATGVSEIRWLAEKMGAKPQTLSGVAGVGDIMLTCFVNLSRNVRSPAHTRLLAHSICGLGFRE